MNSKDNNGCIEMLAQILEDMKVDQGEKFDISKVNLADLERKTGITRAKLRRLKKNGFQVVPHGNKGRIPEHTMLEGFTGVVDNLLRMNVTNSVVIFERIKEAGYTGSQTTVKRYIQNHKDLVPPERMIVSLQGNRGRRYETDAGEMFQMDWGFVNVVNSEGKTYKCACFAMICHHCGEMYIEFFPNAKQENLFIGMNHSFVRMGIPAYVLTDNMKSVVIQRDAEGHPIWQKDYEVFMNDIGFKTKLCKARHPFTKGKVERLVRFVKDNFLAVRTFGTITDLNYEAWKWCDLRNRQYHKATDCIPHKKHVSSCGKFVKPIVLTDENLKYLCPLRKISFDGFVNYEGRRFGVPYTYKKHFCRIHREEFVLTIYDDELERVLVQHNVTWSRKDSYCLNQFSPDQPEEFPSQKVTTTIKQISDTNDSDLFDRFDFTKVVKHDE